MKPEMTEFVAKLWSRYLGIEVSEYDVGHMLDAYRSVELLEHKFESLASGRKKDPEPKHLGPYKEQ